MRGVGVSHREIVIFPGFYASFCLVVPLGNEKLVAKQHVAEKTHSCLTVLADSSLDLLCQLEFGS